MIPPGYTALADGTIIGVKGKPLKPTPNTKGYLKFGARVNGKVRTFQVHAVVCEAFHGEKPFPEAQVRHLDGNKLNNRADNLAWGTSAENAADTAKHGTRMRGERLPTSKLTEAHVKEIRTRYATGGAWEVVGGVRMQDLADEYGVTLKTISLIVNRKQWTHV